MAYETGTASDHKDLLERVRTFVTSNEALTAANQQWELINTVSNGYQLKAPGLSGGEEIFINIDTYEDETNDIYNWRVFGAQGLVTTNPLHLQPQTLMKALLLWNQAMPYWLVVNGQRLMLVVKVSTVYAFTYLGKFMPYATPRQYPYPVVIAGTHKAVKNRWSVRDGYHSSIICPQNSGGAYLPSGSPHDFRVERVTYYNSNDEKSNVVGIEPTHHGLNTGAPIHPNGDGTYNLLPFTLTTYVDGGNVLGELDGLYWVTGIGNASENIITIDGRQFLVFQDVYRTTWKSYAAMELK